MTAPLDQLKDTRRKDSSTALKTMTATGELDSLNSLNTGQQLWTVSPAPRTGSPALQSVMKVPRTPQRGEPHSLPLFIHLRPPPNTPPLPPSQCLRSPHALSASLLRSFVIVLTLLTADGSSQYSPLLVDLCLLHRVWPYICSRQRLTEFPWLKWFKHNTKNMENYSTTDDIHMN